MSDLKNHLNLHEAIENSKEQIKVLRESILEKKSVLKKLQESDELVLVYREVLDRPMAYDFVEAPVGAQRYTYFGPYDPIIKSIAPKPGFSSYEFFYHSEFPIHMAKINGQVLDSSCISNNQISYHYDHAQSSGALINFEVYSKSCNTKNFRIEAEKYQKSVEEDILLLARLQGELNRMAFKKDQNQ